MAKLRNLFEDKFRHFMTGTLYPSINKSLCDILLSVGLLSEDTARLASEDTGKRATQFSSNRPPYDFLWSPRD
jgi:hypothetical protein